LGIDGARADEDEDQQHQLLEGPTTNNNIVFLMFDTAAPLFFCSRLQLHGNVIKIDKVETVTHVKYLNANLEEKNIRNNQHCQRITKFKWG
jgi:hypothetical protein